MRPLQESLRALIVEKFAPEHTQRQSHPVDNTVSERRSMAVTQGIRITVQATYIPEQSSPENHRYVFAYTVNISNEGTLAAQLQTRHWIITDGHGRVQEVKGPGVVGKTPRLMPGESFQYTSGCILETAIGTMDGSYQMHRDNGEQFDAEIAPFTLASPARPPAAFVN